MNKETLNGMVLLVDGMFCCPQDKEAKALHLPISFSRQPHLWRITSTRSKSLSKIFLDSLTTRTISVIIDAHALFKRSYPNRRNFLSLSNRRIDVKRERGMRMKNFDDVIEAAKSSDNISKNTPSISCNNVQWNSIKPKTRSRKLI
ncbi:hypothetical protein CDAR_402481 [Caerostris darwini]|uniref:Uncharacterized protein n=1 Tax=Caerostris darwini TaxID=1538125 RepID=A0AAV4RRP0_9ARAC|nr:hypothetical protein CDAR_402481 [Caerostris darwini]